MRTPMTGVKSNRPEPSTPRGQRFLPETPKSTPTAVPPIYANVHSQLSSGNNRQMSPQIAKILEDGMKENGGAHPRDPPAVPKPAARMSLRHKVIIKLPSIFDHVLFCNGQRKTMKGDIFGLSMIYLEYCIVLDILYSSVIYVSNRTIISHNIILCIMIKHLHFYLYSIHYFDF